MCVFSFRNYRQTCQQLPAIDLSAWQSDEEPEFTTEAAAEEDTVAPSLEEMNESLISAAIEKAKVDMNERARFEYESWLNSAYLINGKKFFLTNFLTNGI